MKQFFVTNCTNCMFCDTSYDICKIDYNVNIVYDFNTFNIPINCPLKLESVEVLLQNWDLNK